MLWIVLGMMAMLAGIVVLVLGSMWGLLLLLGGIGATAFRYVTMIRGRGMEPDQGTINGLNGQGKQQSEAVTVSKPVIGEQPTNIWEKMENQKS